MNPKSQMRSGVFWNMMGSGMMAANTLILNMLVGHFFDLNEVGMFSLALTTAQVLYSLALFGANDLQMTDYDHRFRFTHYFWVKIFSTVLAVGVCFAVIAALRIEGRAAFYTILLTAFMLVNSLAELYQSMFFQRGRLDLSGKCMFYRYLLSTLAFGMALLLGKSIITACIWMLAADCCGLLWWCAMYAGEFRDSWYDPEGRRTASLIKEALPLCLSLMSSLLIINCPKYLINAYLSDEIQGAYSILFMPTYAINLLSQFVFKPFLHSYKDALKEGKRDFGRLFGFHASVCAAFSLCGGFAMWLFGAPLLKLLFGQDLYEYRGMMFLFVLSGGVLAVNQLLYYVMVILCRQKQIFVNFLFGMAITLLTGVKLVSGLSVFGAWLSFTAGQAGLCAGYLFILRLYFKGRRQSDKCEGKGRGGRRGLRWAHRFKGQ